MLRMFFTGSKVQFSLSTGKICRCIPGRMFQEALPEEGNGGNWLKTSVRGPLNNRKLMVAVLLALCVTQQSRSNCGNGAYLKQVGPVPLRFAPPVSGLLSLALPALLREHAPQTNATEIVVAQPTSVKTNSLATPEIPVAIAPTNSATSVIANPQNSADPTPSASDMLVVSPQMLTEFFKPGSEATNSPRAVVVPVPVGFIPPSAPPSSRATYNSP